MENLPAIRHDVAHLSVGHIDNRKGGWLGRGTILFHCGKVCRPAKLGQELLKKNCGQLCIYPNGLELFQQLFARGAGVIAGLLDAECLSFI